MIARFVSLAGLAALLTASLCRGAEGDRPEIALKEQAVVSGQCLTLGDVARLGEEASDALRELALGNSPWPGHVREISRVLVKVRMISAGFPIDLFRFTGSESCTVKLASVVIEPEQIVSAARRHLQSHFPPGGPDVFIELLRDVPAAMLPAAGGEPELRPSLSGSGAPAGTVRVDVDIVRGGARLKRVPTSFEVKLYDHVAVARRKIAPGEQLSRANVEVARREVTNAYGSHMRSLEELKGKSAARDIQPGEMLTGRNVHDAEKPLVIERNQRVFLVVQTRTLRVVTLGRSLSRARLGEVARAENLTTGREVIGVAADQGIIEVPIGERTHDR